MEEVQSSRVQYKKVPLGDRLPDSCSDSDSEAAEDYLMEQNKFRRKSSINMPVPFTEAIIKRLSTGGIRPDQALIMAQEAEYAKRMEQLDDDLLERNRVA